MKLLSNKPNKDIIARLDKHLGYLYIPAPAFISKLYREEIKIVQSDPMMLSQQLADILGWSSQ